MTSDSCVNGQSRLAVVLVRQRKRVDAAKGEYASVFRTATKGAMAFRGTSLRIRRKRTCLDTGSQASMTTTSWPAVSIEGHRDQPENAATTTRAAFHLRRREPKAA